MTDVRKPLMSVARICDTGHRVTFTKSGGTIVNEASGEKTEFERMDNVYRLRVNLDSEEPGFTRQDR